MAHGKVGALAVRGLAADDERVLGVVRLAEGHGAPPAQPDRAEACDVVVVDRVRLLRPDGLAAARAARPAHHEDEFLVLVTELLERVELREVVGERIEFAEVGDTERPDEGRRLPEDEVPALLVLQGEGEDLGLGHRPLEEELKEDEYEPLEALIDDDGDRRLPCRLLVAEEDDEEAELGEQHVEENDDEVRVLELVGGLDEEDDDPRVVRDEPCEEEERPGEHAPPQVGRGARRRLDRSHLWKKARDGVGVGWGRVGGQVGGGHVRRVGGRAAHAPVGARRARTLRYHVGMYAWYSFCRSLYAAHASRRMSTPIVARKRSHASQESTPIESTRSDLPGEIGARSGRDRGEIGARSAAVNEV